MRRLWLFLILIVISSVGITAQAQEAPAVATLNGFTVAYNGVSVTGETTTFTYVVTGTNTPPDLSHFDLQIPDCDPALEVVAYSPAEAVTLGTDPTTGVNGIKWDLPLKVDQTRIYSITFAGEVAEGEITAAVKGGPGFEAGTVPGAACTQAGIDVIKSVSIDGGATWDDAEVPTGPVVDIGAPVSFLIQVYNVGDYPLSQITLTDDQLPLACEIPATLEVDALFECVVEGVAAVEGQNVNTATVTGVYDGEILTDSDKAHYYAGVLPLLTVEKFVAVNGGAWYAADEAPGLQVPENGQVSFRIVVANDGTVPFTNVTVADSMYDLAGCTIPAALAAGENFECVIGPFPAPEGAAVNTVTATAVANGETFTVTDTAHFTRVEVDEDLAIIIIEGPIQAIIDNIIVIYDFEIEIDINDPLLGVIKIGDVIRVEGDWGPNTIIVAITIIIVDVDIYVVDNDLVWRDDSDCGNAPPPWAPAWGWRRKCQAEVIIVRGGGGGRGMGMGMGMGMGR